jgi:hypothetical protein
LLLVLAGGGCGRPKTSAGLATSQFIAISNVLVAIAATGDQSIAISNALAAIAATGDPLTLDELNQMYEEPPAGQNAAPLYGAAFAALTAEDANSSAFLAHNAKAVALLLQAAELPSCRYPVALTNGYSTLVPHLMSIKTCATLLRREAVSQTARGHTDDATTAILAGFRLGRSLDDEPLLISKLVQISSLGQAFDGLQQSLTQRSFSEAELLRLQTALRDAESAVALRRAMLGERAILVAIYQSSDKELAEVIAMSGSSAARQFDLRSYRSAGYLQGDFAFALDAMSNLVALAAVPYPQALDGAAGMKLDAQTARGENLVVSFSLLPPLAEVFKRGAEAVARIRLARTVLAVERYRLKHSGALPTSLAEVSAELSGGIPEDPFDGQPLRYRQLSTSRYAVWSVGTDRKDDGGSIKRPDRKTPLDVVMTIAR